MYFCSIAIVLHTRELLLVDDEMSPLVILFCLSREVDEVQSLSRTVDFGVTKTFPLRMGGGSNLYFLLQMA